MALARTLPGETKKTLCRISFLVTSRISLVTLTSLPTVGGTRRKSRILKERREPCSDGSGGWGVRWSPVRSGLAFPITPSCWGLCSAELMVPRAALLQKVWEKGRTRDPHSIRSPGLTLPDPSCVLGQSSYVHVCMSRLGPCPCAGSDSVVQAEILNF